MNKIKEYKEKYFGSWIEFILTLGISPIKDYGGLIIIYFWGAVLSIIPLLILSAI